MYTITQEGKHQYLRDLARNVSRGQLATRRAGRWVGRVPYGYRIGPDGYLVLGPPEEVAAVREMFAMRVRGCSHDAIAKAMNAKGVKPSRAAQWAKRVVAALLKRKTYLGVVTIGEKTRAKYHRMVAEPEYTEGAHPAIIDQQTWDVVQAMRRKPRRAHTRRESRGAPLAGLLVCGRCGGPMYSMSQRGGCKNTHSHFYRCATNHNGLGCGFCTVPQAAALTMVADAIRKRVLGGSLEALEQEIQRQMANPRKQTSDAAKLRRQLKSIDQKLDRAAARILEVADSLVPRVEAQMVELQKRREALESQLKATSQPLGEDAKTIAAGLWRLDGILRNEDPVEVRAALGHVVERIVLDFEPAGQNKRGRLYRFKGQRARDTAPRFDVVTTPIESMCAVGPNDRWLCELTLEEGLNVGATTYTGGSLWRASDNGILPLTLDAYLDLLNWTARQVQTEKHGSVPNRLSAALEGLHIRAENWLDTITKFNSGFGQVVGRVDQIAHAAGRLDRRWLYGTTQAARAFT